MNSGPTSRRKRNLDYLGKYVPVPKDPTLAALQKQCGMKFMRWLAKPPRREMVTAR